ncbi:MAG: hypothetical protein U9O82_00950, partial [Thermodesulfobacteriota bacterium]|nr:hypothetical protein [Thermodesulfobacteriota bacterium]
FFPHFALTFFARTNKFVHATHQAVTKNGARLSSPKSVIIRNFLPVRNGNQNAVPVRCHGDSVLSITPALSCSLTGKMLGQAVFDPPSLAWLSIFFLTICNCSMF